MKKSRGTYHLLLLAMLSIALSSCYTHRVVGLLQEDEKLPQYEKAEYKPYRIAVNDEIVYRIITMDETIDKDSEGKRCSHHGNCGSGAIDTEGVAGNFAYVYDIVRFDVVVLAVDDVFRTYVKRFDDGRVARFADQLYA